ncbi:MAG TPA: RNA polymerase sigma factor RpoD/SigA [Candidatus Polarisedimenticolia bacterium]|jgi:RNA polymerase primary sigma factor
MRDDELLTSGEVYAESAESAVFETGVGEDPAEPAAATPSDAMEAGTGGESLERYLREVSRWSLLSAEAERDLARRIARGDPRALEDLVNRNLRLVVYWAKRYRSGGLPIQDLIQEGNIGLIRAAEKFDPGKGTRFSTYASWWIRQALARAICDKQDLIRIPVHMHQKLRRVDRMLEGAGVLTSPEMDVEASVEHSGIVSFKEWDGARRLQQPISLDRRQDPSREGPIEVEDSEAISPMRVVYQREIKENVTRMLESLPPRHKAVLALRYGLDGGKEHTLEAIGSRLRISRERVRQIQTEAIEKIAELSGLPRPQPPVTRARVEAVPRLKLSAVPADARPAPRAARGASRRRTAAHRIRRTGVRRIAPRSRAGKRRAV